MSNKINELLQIIKKKATDKQDDDLLSSLKTLKRLLLIQLLEEEVSGLKSILETEKPDAEDIKEPDSTNLQVDGEGEKKVGKDAIMGELEKIAAYKTEDGKKLFILHRPTENFEYSESAEDHDFETTEETEWYAEVMSGEINQDGQNPVVSCWIPEDNITGTDKPHENTGTWGDLGKNPFASSYKVTVKPGKYKIYQELKQRV